MSKRVRPPPERRVYVLPAHLVQRILSHGKAQATEVATLRASHTRQADTIRRLTREHAEVVARLEVMREAVVGVRAERDALAAEVADLQCSVIAFGATAMQRRSQP